MHATFRKLALTILFGIAASSACVAAQGPSGLLAGRLLDPDGRRVERLEADIALTDAQGRRVTGRVSADGTYRIDAIAAGTYALAVELPTRIYERYERAGIDIQAGQRTTRSISRWPGA
ncbi:MAG: carboxypeptidase regulatory-like domain-containing protein [Proteobacteria bacterium]|nr:carboxypeptidase regulatory-like domain-containing protein [Pseudomonadota bacterium]